MVKTRFAPSPTGFLHLGGARTCLFSWLYSRKNKGRFVLRIEDTDRIRSQKEYLDEILESLSWLGIDWDEIFSQSERLNLYRDYAEKLIRKGKAYRKEGAIFFKYEFSKIEIEDLIRGKVIFRELPKDEEVIIRSDNTPTYNFSCVIDDALMGITDVIRGEDHLPNTPKQILLYQALGFSIPQFAHLPLILSEEGGKLSKRVGVTSIREYRKLGYLPQAIVNYLLLLGWSPKENQEIISLEEAKEKFDLKQVNDAPANFSLDKFNWVNAHYIRNTPSQDLYNSTAIILKEVGINIGAFSKEYVIRVIDLFKERISKLSDLVERANFCFNANFSYAQDTEKILERNFSQEVEVLKNTLANLENFDKENIEKEFRKVAERLALKAKDLIHPVRVALTGKRVGPGLFETIEVLGKERTLNRLERLIKYWEERNA